MIFKVSPIRGKASPRLEIHRKVTVATTRTREDRGGSAVGDGLRRRAQDRGGGGSKQRTWIGEQGGARPQPEQGQERAGHREWNPSPVLPCYLYNCVLWARP
jgi:hypothetical protein